MNPSEPLNIKIRPAREEDVEVINEIYNHFVVNSCCTYQTEPTTLEERLRWFDNHQAVYPAIVAQVDGKVRGWASLSPFHERQAFRQSVELSIYVHHDFHGRGVGLSLMEEILQIAKRLEYHVVMSLIDSEQTLSITLHERFGFQHVGHVREVGYKFGKYLDVIYMQKIFDPITRQFAEE